jgi:hypothetical protein
MGVRACAPVVIMSSIEDVGVLVVPALQHAVDAFNTVFMCGLVNYFYF